MRHLTPVLIIVLLGMCFSTTRSVHAQLPPASPSGTPFADLTANITNTSLNEALWEIAEDFVKDPTNLKKPRLPWFELAMAGYDSAWDVLIENLLDAEICSAAKKWTGTSKEFITVTYTVIDADESDGPASTVVTYALGVKGGNIVAYPLTEVPVTEFNTQTGKWEETGEYEWVFDEDGELDMKTWGAHSVIRGDSDPWYMTTGH